MTRRKTAVAALVVLLAVAGCRTGSAVNDYGTVIKGAKGATVRVEVRPGQRFSLAVADNSSVGDNWSLARMPDTKMVSYIAEEHESAGDAPGSGGTTYFVFNAKQPGTTEVRLLNCWRCGQEKTPVSEDSRRQSGEAVFALTVAG